MYHGNKQILAASILTAAFAAAIPNTHASSHREAPYITEIPKLDSTDFYMFRSYENHRQDYVTLIANYLPLQEPSGGPNYFDLSRYGLYEIHIDNDGDSKEDITFSFKFFDLFRDLKVPTHDGTETAVPLKNIGGIGPNPNDLNNVTLSQSYSMTVTYGDRRKGNRHQVINTYNDSKFFNKPVDNIGEKSFADYDVYADAHIFPIAVPGCDQEGRVFVGQRQEGFAVNLGPVFDLVNFNPLGPVDAFENPIGNKNITSIALELPTHCLTKNDPVIGGWTSASLRQAQVLRPARKFSTETIQDGPILTGGAWTQVSRLGMPLVNEIVIGLKDKDQFNASEPKDDEQFLQYVTNPALPELLEILFPGVAVAPSVSRTDLVQVFLMGIPTLNQPANVDPAEMLRLNTSLDIAPIYEQNNLGVIGGDTAGFPNGRRPGDDVVDIELRVAMGALLPEDVAPNANAPLTDGVTINAQDFRDKFPYLNTPLPGALLSTP